MRLHVSICTAIIFAALSLSSVAHAAVDNAVDRARILADMKSNHQQLYPVLRKLRIHNTQECENSATKDLGLLFGVMTDPAMSTDNVIRRALKSPIVTYIVPGGPGSRAGVKVGDRITRVNGQKLRSSRKLRQNLEKILVKARSGPLVLVLMRGGQELSVRVTPDNACSYDMMYIVPTSPPARMMIENIQDKDELAFVMSHHLAHGIVNIPFLTLPILYMKDGSCELSLGPAFVPPTRPGGIVSMCSLRHAQEKKVDAKAVELTARAGFNPLSVLKAWKRKSKKRAQLLHIQAEILGYVENRRHNIEMVARKALRPEATTQTGEAD